VIVSGVRRAWMRAWMRLSRESGAKQLSRPPRGYAASDPDLAWLRLKTLGLNRFYADDEVLKPDFATQVVAAIAAARPLVDFINEALPNKE